MLIYIEYGKEFYDYSGYDFNSLSVLLLAGAFACLAKYQTDKRDFELGARVYFENVGWTEVARHEIGKCSKCALSNRPERSHLGCKDAYFKMLDLAAIEKDPVPAPEIKSPVCSKCGNVCTIHASGESLMTVGMPDYKALSDCCNATIIQEIKYAQTLPALGTKYDSGKLRPSLIPPEVIRAVVEVMTYGANKYSADNWKQVEPERYIDALWRHYIAWKTGEKNDAESGLSHAAHFATNALFLLWFELEKVEVSE